MGFCDVPDSPPSAVAVIKASELWEAMEPELLQTVQAELEASGQDGEGDKEVDWEGGMKETDQATAVSVAQLLRDNKYRCVCGVCVVLCVCVCACSSLLDSALMYAIVPQTCCTALYPSPQHLSRFSALLWRLPACCGVSC